MSPAENAAEPMLAIMWASMASWFTPTVLFCVLNLVIGTIFITRTRSTQQPEGEPNPPQLIRAPSILERVRSFNFALYRSEHPEPVQTETHHVDSPPEKAQGHGHDVTNPDPVQTENHHVDPPPEKAQGHGHNVTNPEPVQTETHHVDPPPEKAQRHGHDVTRSKSDKTGEAPPARASAKMKKWASEKSMIEEMESEEEVDRRRPATMRENRTASLGEDEAVDAKADDFINRFKQQLKLQRLDSLLRFSDMLNRGAGPSG